jgi:hypothetical protein
MAEEWYRNMADQQASGILNALVRSVRKLTESRVESLKMSSSKIISLFNGGRIRRQYQRFVESRRDGPIEVNRTREIAIATSSEPDVKSEPDMKSELEG